MKIYSWMRPTDDEIAVQLNTLAGGLTPALATSLGISAAERDKLIAGAAFFAYLQLELSGAARAFSLGVTKVRDLFEADKTPESLVVPVADFPAAPAAIAGQSFESDFFAWVDKLIKRIKVAPDYTEQIGMDLDIEYSAPAALKILKITGHDELPGGEIRVRVSRAFPMTILEAAVDGAAFKGVAMLPVSELVFHVAAGAPHGIQVRARGAERDGTPVGDYTAILSITSQG